MAERFKVLIRRGPETEMWDAQVLEHDAGSQGKNPEELLANLDAVLSAEISEGLDDIDPAPKIYQDQWEKGNDFLAPFYKGPYSYDMRCPPDV